MEAKDLMVINGGNGESSEILGKFLYYSFPRTSLLTERHFWSWLKDMVSRQV